MKIKLALNHWLETLFVWTLILNCRSVYMSTIVGAKEVAMFLCAISMIMLLFRMKQISVRKLCNGILGAFGLFLFLGFYILVTDSDTMEAVKSFAILIIMVVFYSLYCDKIVLQRLIKKYVYIMAGIAAFSIFMWIFASLLGFIQPTGTVFSTWGDMNIRNYGYVYYETQKGTSLMQLLGIDIYRNTAIFNEAPMYALQLIMAITFNEFVMDEENKKATILLAAAVVTSFSSAGLISLVMIAFMKYIITKSKNKISLLLKIFLIPTILLVGAQIVSLLLANKINSSSGMIRLDDFKAWGQVWKNHLILGAGFGTKEYIRYLASWRRGTGISTSLGMILGYGGIWLLSLYALPVIRTLRASVRTHNIRYICFVLVFLFLFSTNEIPFQFITYFVIVSMSDAFKSRTRATFKHLNYVEESS